MKATSKPVTEQVEALFDRWTKFNTYPHFKKHEYHEVFHSCPALFEGPKRVLDVGCGVGYVAAALKELGHHVTGVDLSSSALEQARKAGLIDQGSQEDIRNTSFASEQFDVVLCWSIFMLVPDLKPAMREVQRILRPGGVLLVADHFSGNPYVKLHFNRPSWVDRILEGHPNVPRWALNPEKIESAGKEFFNWEAPIYYSMFTEHPHRGINLAHRVARLGFSTVRKITRRPWTGNWMSMVGKKRD